MINLYTFFSIIYVIVCISLIVVIMLQKKRSSGLGNVMSGSNMNSSNETYWNKNRCRSLEGILEKYTKILGSIFIILSFLLCLIK